MQRAILIALGVSLGCQPFRVPPPEAEGDDPGECEDDADNDQDGLFDCDDPDCAGAGACADDDDSGGDDDDSAQGDDDDSAPVDEDGDGFAEGADCDDSDPAVHPGAKQACDGVADNDCDGIPDPNEADADSDGTTVCGGDCDDADAGRFPGNWAEACQDGVDANCDGEDWYSVGDADFTLNGQEPGAQLGRGVGSAGDLDGDGLPDLLVAEPFGEAVYVVSGADTVAGGVETAADIAIGVLSGSSTLGWAADSIGDIDGDGLDDVIVGTAGDQAYVFAASSILAGPLVVADAFATLSGPGGSQFGNSVTSLGDLDGDGLHEVAVTARRDDTAGNDAGAVYLFSGATLAAGGPLGVESALGVLLGEAAEHGAGRTVEPAGDVDGDGLTDLITGAPSQGRAYVVFASTFLNLALGQGSLASADVIVETGECCFGRGVAGVGDLDGDGLAEVAVGDPGSGLPDQLVGVHLFTGSTLASGGVVPASDADVFIEAGDDHDSLGRRMKGGGDVDGDGLSDLLVNSQSNLAGPDAGSTLLFLGSSLVNRTLSSADDADTCFVGDGEDQILGHGLAFPGDVNGDGAGDLLLGAPHAIGEAGEAHVMFSPYAE